MSQHTYTFFKITLFILLLQPVCTKAQSIRNTDSVITAYDTVYYTPDTIKTTRIDTVFEYVEEPSKGIISIKAKDICFLVGPHVGFGISHLSPIYNKTSLIGVMSLQGMYVYNHLFANLGIGMSTMENARIQYNRNFNSLHHWVDTIKTIKDTYIEIIGKDTFQRQSIKITLVPKTDTLNTDTVYSHKNEYRFVNIPIVCGYIFKKKKTWYGFGLGTNFRLMFIDASNKVVWGDSSFVSEKSYVKKISIDVNGILFVKHKISKKIWTSVQLSCTIPVTSSYDGYNSKLYRQSYCFLVGFEYFFKR